MQRHWWQTFWYQFSTFQRPACLLLNCWAMLIMWLCNVVEGDLIIHHGKERVNKRGINRLLGHISRFVRWKILRSIKIYRTNEEGHNQIKSNVLWHCNCIVAAALNKFTKRFIVSDNHSKLAPFYQWICNTFYLKNYWQILWRIVYASPFYWCHSIWWNGRCKRTYLWYGVAIHTVISGDRNLTTKWKWCEQCRFSHPKWWPLVNVDDVRLLLSIKEHCLIIFYFITKRKKQN